MKKIIFSELNFITLFIMPFSKLFFSEVYFFRISKTLRRINLIKFFKLIEINWLNYHENKTLKNYTKFRADSIKLSKKLAKKNTDKMWDPKFKDVFIKKKYLYIALHKIFKKKSDDFTELILASKMIKSKKNETVYFWTDINFISSYIFSNYPGCYNIKLKIPYLSHLILFLKIFIKLFNSIILNLFAKFKKISFYRQNDEKIKSNINKSNINKDKIIYFAHKGLPASREISDNIYYSKNKNNNSYYKKILHLEWFSKDIRNNGHVKNFYKKNNIHYDFWENYKINLQSKIIIFFQLIIFLLKTKFKKNPMLIEIISELFLQINSSKKKINKYFYNTQIALVEYEYLFPISLSIALKSANIKIISAQTRILMPTLGESYLCDLYLTLGKKSSKEIKKQICKPAVKLLGIKNNKLANKTNLKTKKIKHVFVYDIKSEKDWYMNGRKGDYNWKENYLFYSLIVEKAKIHKNTMFYIKGKNYNWMNIPYFRKILYEIKKQKNILILNKSSDREILGLNRKADLFIAIYTSAVDKALANGKPVIIYDICDDKITNYGNLKVTSKEQFDICWNNYQINYFNLNYKINKLRKYFYSNLNFFKVRSFLDRY